MQIAKQARNERGQKLFQIFRQEENEVYIASLARWDTQLKGSVEMESRCQELMQEVKLLSERQEVLAGLVEDKSGLQSEATEENKETIFEEMTELEQKKWKALWDEDAEVQRKVVRVESNETQDYVERIIEHEPGGSRRNKLRAKRAHNSTRAYVLV